MIKQRRPMMVPVPRFLDARTRKDFHRDHRRASWQSHSPTSMMALALLKNYHALPGPNGLTLSIFKKFRQDLALTSIPRRKYGKTSLDR